jgi:hypothetical protein
MTEADVLVKTHQFLNSQQLANQPVVQLYTDVHGTLLGNTALKPFQRFYLDMGGFILHPDLVGRLGDGETIFAIEGKGDRDMIKGLAQAEMYQTGFHYSFLAAKAHKWVPSLVQFARRKNIGVIAVDDDVTIVHTPEAHMPLRDAFQFVSRQMETVVQVTQSETFYYNAATHYLAWCIALQPNVSYNLKTKPSQLAGYPMPKDWQAALRGAKKLKLVNISGDEYQLSPIGEAIKVILPTSLTTWSEVHEQAGARGSKLTVAEYHPQAGALLRILLLDDPMVRLIVKGLTRSPNKSANFAQLARICDQLDHARTLIFFFNPELANKITDEQGRILWDNLKGENYRSTMFYQFKRILQHAGILKKTRLGSHTAKNCDPTRDIWELP